MQLYRTGARESTFITAMDEHNIQHCLSSAILGMPGVDSSPKIISQHWGCGLTQIFSEVSFVECKFC